jgi:ATP-dependent DNA helicase RecG
MNLPININDILTGRSVEWERLEFKAGWNPQEVIRTLCAFANDFHNLGGGYLVIGINEDKGRPILPPAGLPRNQLDAIQKEIIELGHRIIPYYHPVISPYEIQGKHILVLWAAGGQSRPYKAPVSLARENREYAYYIRKGSLTVRAGYQDEMELMGLAAKIPFDDRMHHSATPEDLDLGLIRTYLRQVKSDLYELSVNMNFVQLSRQMNIVDGPEEAVRPKNAGLMFFNEHPDRFFPQTQIDVVHFPEGPGADSFTEKIFKGPLNRMLAEALSYIKSTVIQEKVIKHSDRAEASRCFNYPFAAIEEALCNAIYHRSYEIREPVEVRILPDRITVTSFPGPDRSISSEDIKQFRFLARRYRNRRIGEFLKELDLTEGRGTGIPKILRKINANGSPLPIFLTDDNRTYFVVEFPIHPVFLPEKNKKEINSEKGSKKIIELLLENSNLTIQDISRHLRISTRAVEKQIHTLKETGLLKRKGGRKTGWWEVKEK